MRHSFFHRRHAGFLLLEVMLGIGVLGTYLSGIGLSLLLGQEHTIMAGDRMRAVSLAQSALEAARAIRDDDFDTLLSAVGAGEQRVAIDEGTGTWKLLPDVIIDEQGFRTALTVDQEGDGHVRIQAETKWKRGYNRSGSVLIATHLTDWRAPPAIGNWATVIVQGSGSIASVVPLFTAAAVAGDYLYATAENGDGLYVINLSDLSNPQLATSVPLSASGVALAIHGDRLYVLTNDPVAELQVFDITDPAKLSLSDRKITFDLEGAGRGRSLAFYGDQLLVGATKE